MGFRIACPSCSTQLAVENQHIGMDVSCPTCQTVLRIANPAAGSKPASAPLRSTPAPAVRKDLPSSSPVRDTGIADRERRAPVRTPAPSKATKPASARSRGDDEEDDETPRSRRRRSSRSQGTSSGGSLTWILLGGGGLLVAILGVTTIVLVSRRGGTNQNAVAQNPQQNPPAAIQPVAQNQPINPVVAARPVEIPKTAMSGEQIYQRLLKSTVYIESKLNLPPRPVATNPIPPRPPFGGPPGMAGQSLANTVWEGSETLQGYGKLRFEFITANQVVMIDARDRAAGTYSRIGSKLTLDFNGCIYSGLMVGNSFTGSANDNKNRWSFNVTRNAGAQPGAAPPANAPGTGGGVARSSGTGALVDATQRLVITNVHVVGNADTVELVFPGHDAKGDLQTQRNDYPTKLTGKVVMREIRADLALVQLDALPGGVQPLPISSSKAKPAQQVHSVGNPGASQAMWIYSPGKVRQVYKDKWQIRDPLLNKTEQYDAVKLETDSPINPGDSGGPLVNDRGILVGVAHGQFVGANNMSYFIEASEVRDLMQRYYQSIGQTWVAQATD